MTPPKLKQRYTTVPVEALDLHPRNPRRGDLDVIGESIEANGFFGAIIVQESTGYVIVGNHRLQAARKLRMEEVPVCYVDVDDEAALRIMLADNRTAELATNDNEQLMALLSELAADGLTGTGYVETDLDDLLRAVDATAPAVDPAQAWVGMPEFTADDKQPAVTVTMHFASEEDVEAFFALIGVPRNRFAWWPANDGHVGSNLRETYVADDDQ